MVIISLSYDQNSILGCKHFYTRMRRLHESFNIHLQQKEYVKYLQPIVTDIQDVPSVNIPISKTIRFSTTYLRRIICK